MKIVIPSIPSGYAQPYPELVLEGTLAQMRDLGNALRCLDTEEWEPICPRVRHRVRDVDAAALFYRAMEEALEPHAYVVTHVIGYRYNSRSLSGPDIAKLRSTWVEHIHRTIHEQLGECQT